MGKQFPRWMSDLKKLVTLTLKNCRRCETMPTLGHLPNLKNLQVERMDGIKVIGNEFYGESNNVDALFPLLEEFSIFVMKSLVEWVAPTGTEIFPKLRELKIVNCPNLTSFPWSQSTSSANGMVLLGYSVAPNVAFIMCPRDFKALQGLRIWECPKLTFHHIGLTSMQSFAFREYEKFPYVHNLLERSNKLGKSWKVMSMQGVVEIIREFPKSLEALEIKGLCNGLSAEAFHGLSCLTYLHINDCNSLESISSLSSLTSLEHLEIYQCSRLELIPSPTSLKHLEIYDCASLESISSLSSLVSLEHLGISSCPRLESIPSISSSSSLKHLELRGCDRLEPILTLSSFSTCLEKLIISQCHNLRSLSGEIKLCTSLVELKVAYCGGMVSIDDDVMGHLTQLKKLVWGGFSKELDQLPGLDSIHLLTSLQELEIIGWNKLTSLPSQIERLTSITHLEIRDFDGLESLPDWICNLSSLQKLCIYKCTNLKNLPTRMQRLSRLTMLHIALCPLLKERCVKETGPEWSNISHIPLIGIDLEVI